MLRVQRWILRWTSVGCVAFAIHSCLLFPAQGQSIVPMMNNGFYANNASMGQAGWSGFGYFCQTAICGPSSLGKYQGFTVDDDVDGMTPGGGSNAAWNVTVNVDVPFNSNPGGTGSPILGIDTDDIPFLDLAAFGTNFNPNDYMIDVVYKPLPGHQAPMFDVTLDTFDGFITSDVGGVTKGRRYAEQIRYRFGIEREGMEEEDLNVIEYYEQAPKDADGFATISTGINDGMGGQNHLGNGPSFMFQAGALPDNEKVTGDNVADFNDIESANGAVVPNGALQIYFQSLYGAANTLRMNVEIKDIRIRPRNGLGTTVARFDERSGIGYRWGTPLRTSTLNANATNERGTDQATDVVTPYDTNGDGVIQTFMGVPIELARIRDTDRLRRFNPSGGGSFLNGIEVHTDEDGIGAIDTDDIAGEFGIWQDHMYQVFDGTQASIHFRYRTLSPVFLPGEPRANRVALFVKDMDGNDTAAGQGLEQYRYDVTLNTDGQFHEYVVPLSSFTSRALGFEGLNDGDGSLTEFNLYYMGVGLIEDIGLLDLEIDYFEIRRPALGLPGDYNGDLLVDAADYTVWRNNLGTGFNLNGNGDETGGSAGIVDEADYNWWRRHYGSPPPPGGGGIAQSASVPEPATWILLSTVVGALGCVRRRCLG